MSEQIKTHIVALGYRATVTIPSEVWDGMVRHRLDGDVWERTLAACRIGSGCDGSGSNRYSDCEEWADFPSEGLARSWIAVMETAIREVGRTVRRLDDVRRLDEARAAEDGQL